MKDPDRPQKSIVQELADGTASALDDVRHKVIEEPWYGWRNGREVTENVGTLGNWAQGDDAWNNTQKPEEGMEFLRGNEDKEQGQERPRGLVSDKYYNLPSDRDYNLPSDVNQHLRSDRDIENLGYDTDRER